MPDGPPSTVHAPAFTAKLTPETTGNRMPPCRCMVKVLVTPSRVRAGMAPSWRQDRGDEKLGVGLARIMGHHDGGEAQLRHQAAHQVEEARLYRDIEAAGRLIHEDEAWLGHQVAGDLQPLAHSARISARRVVDAVLIDFDAREPAGR